MRKPELRCAIYTRKSSEEGLEPGGQPFSRWLAFAPVARRQPPPEELGRD
jgi:hypothetical protein